jgi:hypothetical protein
MDILKEVNMKPNDMKILVSESEHPYFRPKSILATVATFLDGCNYGVNKVPPIIDLDGTEVKIKTIRSSICLVRPKIRRLVKIKIVTKIETDGSLTIFFSRKD